MSKKILLFPFVLLLIASLLLGACTPAAAPEAQEPEEAEPVEEAPAVEEEPAAEEPAAEEPAETEEETPAEDSKVGGTLVYALNTEPDSLDPHKASQISFVIVGYYMGGSLVTKDVEGNYVPYLAESWEVSDDGLQYTFKLKENILFHDGTPCTAEDFVYTFTRAMDPEIESPQAGTILQPVDTVEAVDEYTLVITLKEPFFSFIEALAKNTGFLMPIPQQAVEAMGDEFARNPISVGPWKFKEWATGEKVVLERNPDFNWGPEFAHDGPVFLETLEFRIVPDPATIVAGLESGGLDYAGLVEPKDIPRLEESGLFTISAALTQGMWPYMYFPNDAAPFTDINVRKAMNYAINREAMIALLANEQAVPQYGPLTESQIGYWPGVEEIAYTYDPEMAVQLLEESGYAMGDDGIMEKDGEKLAFTVSCMDRFSSLAEVIKDQFSAVGIDLTIELLDGGIVFEKLTSHTFDFSIGGWTQPEADLMYSMFHSTAFGGQNIFYTAVFPDLAEAVYPELDDMLLKTRTTTDPAERQEYVTQAQEFIVENAIVIFLYTPYQYQVINNRIKDAQFSSKVIDYPYLWDAYIE